MLSSTSRHAFLISAAVCLLVGGMGQPAAAKDCITDSDCGTGYQCAVAQVVADAKPPVGGATSVGSGAVSGTGSDGAGGATGIVCPAGVNCGSVTNPPTKAPVPSADAGVAPQPNPLPPIPVPTPAVTGICEPKPIVCASVADCPSADFDCLMVAVPPSGPTCPADVSCGPPVPQTSGTCVAKLRACSTAADCPVPLTCQAEYSACSGGGSAGPDGVVTTIPTTCTPGPLVCTWVPAICATDSDCADPLYQCVKVSESSMCSGSSGVCAKGETCAPAPPPTCATQAIMNCLPKLIDCASGRACPTGWSCFDFSNVGGVPPALGSIASSKACLPDGIIFAAQGHAAGGSQVTGSVGSRGGGSVDLGPATGTGVKGENSTATPTDVGTGGSSGGTGPTPADRQPPTQGAPTASSDAGVKGETSTATATATATDVGPGSNPSPSNAQPPTQGAPTATNSDAGVGVEPMAHASGCSYGGSATGGSSLVLALIGLLARRARRRTSDR